ncbi:hypothetical protein Rhopal_006727-T1 [Rhodotorula paludigena]|uniref:F-box domain-containing protein n=1 Tax=Rhodotorula paludigena TaxID=86838 RepID=A0AAV5GUS6_9BASI|nr:hypothetical protein Rhopal_006727-T1 [Rhodotorula paludigena]
MSRRTSRARVSYVEVDSDVDIASSDDEAVQGGTSAKSSKKARGSTRGVGDTYGARKPAQQLQRPSGDMEDSEADETEEEEEREDDEDRKVKVEDDESDSSSDEDDTPAFIKPEPSLSLERFLGLPAEMLSEIVSHLDTEDLMRLASTSRPLRKLLVARSGRTFWTTVRKRDGYDLLDDLGEIDFALLLYGLNCQICGTWRGRFHNPVRIRACSECSKEHLIAYKLVKKEMPYLHCQAVDASSAYETAEHTREDLYLRQDLVAVSEQLEELAESDEQAREFNTCHRPLSTRSRRSSVEHQHLAEDQVQQFVERSRSKREADSTYWDEAMAQKGKLEAKRRQEQRDQERNAQARLEADLEQHHGWTREQLRDMSYRYHGKLVHLKPSVAPSENAKAWRRYRKALQKDIDRRNANDAADAARERREQFLKAKFSEYNEKDERFQGILPNFFEFSQLEPIKALWHPLESRLDDSTWRKTKRIVDKALIDFAENTRVDLIRLILAAQTGKTFGKLSTKPAKYPAREYGDAFFARPTASFGFRPLFRPYQLMTLPERLKHVDAYECIFDSVRDDISRRQVIAIEEVIDATGLDVDTVTLGDLDELSGTFYWSTGNSDFSSSSWTSTVQHLANKAPLIRMRRDGESVGLVFERDSSDNDGDCDDEEDDEDETDVERSQSEDDVDDGETA